MSKVKGGFILVDGVEITTDDLKPLYEHCNKKYFEGQLGKCGFSFFSKNISYLGWYQGREDKEGRPKDKIWIGKCVKWTKDALERVMFMK